MRCLKLITELMTLITEIISHDFYESSAFLIHTLACIFMLSTFQHFEKCLQYFVASLSPVCYFQASLQSHYSAEGVKY